MQEKPRFNRDVPNMYVELLNFQLEVMDILGTRARKINDEERITVIKSWPGLEHLLLLKTFIQEQKENFKITEGPFSVLNIRFKPCHYYIILSLQHDKSTKKPNVSAKEWMVRLGTKEVECEYRQPDLLLTEQFMGG